MNREQEERLIEKIEYDIKSDMIAQEEKKIERSECPYGGIDCARCGEECDQMTDKNKAKYDLTDDGTGKKYDAGKSMVGTLCRVFPRALLQIGKCIEFGTHKYPDPANWKKVEGAYKRYQDSMMRHYLKHCSDITNDEETGILHLAHMCWNGLAVLELYLMEHDDKT